MLPLLIALSTASAQPDDLHELLEILERSGYPEVAAARLADALYRQPDHPDAPLVRLRLASFQQHDGNPAGAAWTLRQGAGQHPEVAPWFELALADVYATQARWPELLDALQRFGEPTPETADALAFYRSWGHVGVGQLDEASAWLGRVEGPLAPTARTFERELASAPELERRSPGLASALSVVPGLGQAYVGHVGRGAALFAATGGLGASALLQDDEPALTAVLGAVTLGLWAWAVVDARRQAIRFNERRLQRRVARYQQRWSIQAEPTSGGERLLDVTPVRPTLGDAPDVR